MTEITDTYDRADANTAAGAALPMSIPVSVVISHSRIVILTKFFSWLTACLLATAVLISLISANSQRSDLRHQLTDQSKVQACRSEANYNVSRASSQKDIALAAHSVLVGDFITTIIRVPEKDPERVIQFTILADKLDAANKNLRVAGENLRAAVDAQETALTTCNED